MNKKNQQKIVEEKQYSRLASVGKCIGICEGF